MVSASTTPNVATPAVCTLEAPSTLNLPAPVLSQLAASVLHVATPSKIVEIGEWVSTSR